MLIEVGWFCSAYFYAFTLGLDYITPSEYRKKLRWSEYWQLTVKARTNRTKWTKLNELKQQNCTISFQFTAFLSP